MSLLGKFIWYTHIVSLIYIFYSYFTKSSVSFYLIFFLFLLAFSNLIYYTYHCRKVTFYNPLLIIYTPLKRSMAPPSVFYFVYSYPKYTAIILNMLHSCLLCEHTEAGGQTAGRLLLSFLLHENRFGVIPAGSR